MSVVVVACWRWRRCREWRFDLTLVSLLLLLAPVRKYGEREEIVVELREEFGGMNKLTTQLSFRRTVSTPGRRTRGSA